MRKTPTLALLGCWLLTAPAWSLNPHKLLTQYTRTVWTQEHGLPQDTIRAIAQTSDGYLWLGTDEGLARFDGYDFLVFGRDNGDLPSNSVNSLYAARDGALWIGTSEGLACYRNKRFTVYGVKDGLADKVVNSVTEDQSGAIWIASGFTLSALRNGKFSTYEPGESLPLQAARVLYQDKDRNVWLAGFGGVAKLIDGEFKPIVDRDPLRGDSISSMIRDRSGNLWLGGRMGLWKYSTDGRLKLYNARDGLPDRLVRALWEDRDGALWAGTNGGLSRLEGDRFVSLGSENSRGTDWVRCVYEDREGNLWVGMNSGLNRFRDDIFTVFTRAEGLPSDEPNTVYQDRAGNIWVGFHTGGLMRFQPGNHQVYTTGNGLPGDGVFCIREHSNGDLLIGTREGLTRLHEGRFKTFVVPDDQSRKAVFDILEDREGRLLVATPAGLSMLAEGKATNLVPGGPLLNNAVVVLCGDGDGGVWAGTYGIGLWHYKDGKKRLFTPADGLSSDRIRSLVRDRNGVLWIGTFGGGLNAYANGRFTHYTAKNGLLSDNISHVQDDGRDSLWLSTTLGVCKVDKKQLRQLDSGEVKALTPVNYGVKDGLRSAQCSPSHPTSAGGTLTSDGRLWIPTSRGLAVLPVTTKPGLSMLPILQLTDINADRVSLDLATAREFGPANGRIQFRYTGIYLSSPERVRYAYRLEGLDRDWIQAGTRRTANYNSLRPGKYRFVVKASLPGGESSETSFAFRLRPHFYETVWFLGLCALAVVGLAWAAYQLRLRQIRGRFSAVLEERARLAREIHDTLAQGFVGISSQLEAVSITLDAQPGAAKGHLELARKMARHSLTEARRSVTDLRASALEDHDLPAALAKAAPQWIAGSAIKLELDMPGEALELPEHLEQHLLRIAQEAVTNAVKHAQAQTVRIGLKLDGRQLRLSVRDDGSGFEPRNAFSSAEGHFGILGMRERAQRLGGKLSLDSEPGHGTRVEVTVPLS